MQRHAIVKNSFNPAITPGISDEEALLVQLCAYLFDAGFLFTDADHQEVNQGQDIIQGFYEQEDELVMRYLPQDLLTKFINYINEHQWTSEEIENKVRIKIVKSFDQLAQGTSHSLNIQRNIHLGLLQFHQHALRDFLLYLTAYNTLVLEEEESIPMSDQSFTINDLKHLRQKFQDRMEGHKLVEVLLKDISRIRGGHMPLEDQGNRKPRKSYQFFRPSEHSQGMLHAFKQPTETLSTSSSQAESSPSSLQSSQEPNKSPTKESTASEKKLSAKLLLNDDIEDLEFEEQSSNHSEDDASIIYGTGRINRNSFIEFIETNPDSALKFLFRRDITERKLSQEVLQIYEEWEERGLKRGYIRKYILELMDWDEIPIDQTILELSGILKDRIYDSKRHLIINPQS